MVEPAPKELELNRSASAGCGTLPELQLPGRLQVDETAGSNVTVAAEAWRPARAASTAVAIEAARIVGLLQEREKRMGAE